jgi:hypothetical protein
MSAATSTDVQRFIARWRASGASERANHQLFVAELCEVLGVEPPRPAGAVHEKNDYTFERFVRLRGEGEAGYGYIDLYKRGCFVLEAKQGADAVGEAVHPYTLERTRLKAGTATRETRNWERSMKRAMEQALRYARALPAEDGWPPFLVVLDVGYCIDLYADFARQGKTYLPFPDGTRHRILLEHLADPAVREVLRMVWTDPLALDPTRRTARVTRDLAEKLARLAASLERGGHQPDVAAGFLMRCLFTMFAEDVGLLPPRSFHDLLARHRDRPDLFPDALSDLWQRMNEGGYAAGLGERVPQFNGGLFADTTALPLSPEQIDLLIVAAEFDWTDVEPAIFGTLLERALDPRERHKLGAHFTPRAYVERLVLPAVVEPLRDEWNAVQAAAAAHEIIGDEAAARREVQTFHRRLCSLRVLDPACGTGNFLYVALEHLKRLEGEVVIALSSYAGQQTLDMTGGHTVSPAQFLGLEVNPRAAAIADVVLWIGYLQWHFRTYGDARRLDPPILKTYRNVECRDAVLDYDERRQRLADGGEPVTRWDGRTTRPHPVTGEPVPDETARTPVYDYTNPRPADWPEAEFIVGNPPFVGNKRMRDALGDGYTEALRAAYADVPDSADFVMYWWHKAAQLVREGKVECFGFITTNSITMTFNRRVVDHHMSAEPSLRLVYAIPDHPWVDESGSAAVRIAMTVATSGEGEGRLARVVSEAPMPELGNDVALEERTGEIHSDLTAGANVSSATPLEANKDISSFGMMLAGSGFIVDPQAAQRLGLGQIPGLENHIRPYRNGRDLTQSPRGVLLIDLFGMTPDEIASRFPAVYQHILDHVRPERDHNRRRKLLERWWEFGEARITLRRALQGLRRYIATPETAKHRFFVFLDAEILPDHKLIAIASEDAYHLGVLSSRIHVTWALAAGGRLGVGNDPVYNSTRCFQPFPFPLVATREQEQAIRLLGERLDAHRKRAQAEHPDLTLTGLYNVLEKVRGGHHLTEAERDVYDRGLVGILAEIHDRLDRAVAEAYGWPPELSDEEILERLVALNHERTAEEEQGVVRYLRPAFQNPQGTQAALAMDAVVATRGPARRSAGRADWPSALPERMRAVQQLLASEHAPVTPEVVATRFRRARKSDAESILEALATLGLVRATEEGFVG